MQRIVAGIRFSNYVFSEPVPLSRWWPPRGMGLFVILVPDYTWQPRPFQPVYVGEFGHSYATVTSEEYISWFRVAAGKDLFISAYQLPDHRTAEIPRIRDEIVRLYAPVCSRRWGEASPSADALGRRLDAIERRDTDHDALLRILVAALGKILTPPPEPGKKDYGFKPADTRAPVGSRETRRGNARS